LDKKKIDSYIEPLILYIVLFFRFSPGVGQTAEIAKIVEFSPYAEIIRIFLYNIPSLALIRYLLLRTGRPENRGVGFFGVNAVKTSPVSRKKDIVSTALSLPALVCISLAISQISFYIKGIPSGPRFMPPQNAVSWIILIFSCFSTVYLEESFFRFYLLSKGIRLGIGPRRAVLISTLLFSICHIYEGPWGFLNAALSGTVLAVVFLRFRSLHGISAAHALYNILVYIHHGNQF